MDTRRLRAELDEAIKDYTIEALEGLQVSDVRKLMDVSGITSAYIKGMIAGCVRDKAMQEVDLAAAKALSSLKDDFPTAEAVVMRRRRFKIFLTGREIH